MQPLHLPPRAAAAQTWDAREVRRFLERLAEARTGLRRRAPQPGSSAASSSPGLARSSEPGPTAWRWWSTHSGQGGARAVGVVGLLRWGTRGVGLPRSRAALGDRHDRAPRHGGIRPAPGRTHRRCGGRRVRRLRSLAGVRARRASSALRERRFGPAEAAYTPVLTNTPEELSAANVVAAAIESVGIFVGPALGEPAAAAATNTGTVFLATAGALSSYRRS